jgi:hypothetical protein
MATGDGEAVGWLQASTPASSGAPPVKMKTPKGAAVFGDPSGTVDSAQAVTHRCGGELHTVAKISTIADQNSPYNGHYIYDSLHRIVDDKDSNTFIV